MLMRIVDLLRTLRAPAQVGRHHVDAAGDQFRNARLDRDELEFQRHAQAVRHGLADIHFVAHHGARLRILEAEWFSRAHGAADELAARLDVLQGVRLGGGQRDNGQANGGQAGRDHFFMRVPLDDDAGGTRPVLVLRIIAALDRRMARDSGQPCASLMYATAAFFDLRHGRGEAQPQVGRQAIGRAIQRGHARYVEQIHDHIQVAAQHAPIRRAPSQQTFDRRIDIERALRRLAAQPGTALSRATMRSRRSP